MHSWRTIDLGTHPTLGREAHLTISVEPDPESHKGQFTVSQDATNWCVSLHMEGRLPNDSNEEIAVIDTQHGGPHIDRYYTASGPDDQDKKWLTGWTYDNARDYLLANWKDLIDEYIANHGAP